MKALLCSLNQLLTFHLEAMYYAEKRIQKELPEMVLDFESRDAVDMVSRYVESASDKRLKLKRIFSYLLAGPFRSSNGAVGIVVSECSDIMDLTKKGCHRDILLASTLQALIEYKVTTYNAALKIALQMDLKKVTELLEDIISWEVEAAQNMSDFVSQQVIESNTFAMSSPKALQ